jgi:hypothetical protein
MRHLIPIADLDLRLLVHEEPARESRYRKAGSPVCCAVPHCRRRFADFCIRGDDDRYYCSEVCAQIGFEIDFDRVANSFRGTTDDRGDKKETNPEARSLSH